MHLRASKTTSPSSSDLPPSSQVSDMMKGAENSHGEPSNQAVWQQMVAFRKLFLLTGSKEPEAPESAGGHRPVPPPAKPPVCMHAAPTPTLAFRLAHALVLSFP
jgi:hypothetical protein